MKLCQRLRGNTFMLNYRTAEIIINAPVGVRICIVADINRVAYLPQRLWTAGIGRSRLQYHQRLCSCRSIQEIRQIEITASAVETNNWTSVYHICDIQRLVPDRKSTRLNSSHR